MTDLAHQLIRRYFGTARGELIVGSLPVARLCEQYGTPLYLYASEVLDRKIALLRGALPDDFRVCYSVKANPNPTLLAHFVRAGCGLEVASAGELLLALRAGCAAGDILFAGPGKTLAELELALSRGVGEIHAESLLEVQRLGAIARRLGVRAQVALRVNPSADAAGGAMQMGGRAAPFGIDEERLEPALSAALADPGIDCAGIHVFSGTQILDSNLLLAQHRTALAIARRVAARIGRPLRTVDLGGGLGIPYFAGECELDMAALRDGLAKLMAGLSGEGWAAGTRFVLEPGRYLVGEAGIYVARVTDIKVSRGRTFLVLDGGMHHHLAAAGHLGQVVKRHFPLALLTKLDRPPEERVDVAGPLCTPLDCLARDAPLPRAEVGDLLGIFQSGAYALSASPLGFLTRPAPPELLVEGGTARIIRPRGPLGRAEA
jgi:diaminopimelate decarboxylase